MKGEAVLWLISIFLVYLVLILNRQPVEQDVYTYNLSCPELVCKDPVCNMTCPPQLPCPDCVCNPVNTWVVKKEYTSHLQEVASSVAEMKEHSGKESWDCDDMAEEAEERLEAAGYDCRDVCGTYYEYEWVEYPDGKLKEELVKKTGHCWVECDNIIIEATDKDDPIVPAEKYRQYKR